MRTVLPLFLSCLILIGFGCVLDPRTGHGLRLPDGDVERGELVFREIGCQECHRVVGGPNSSPGDRLDVIVTLGNVTGPGRVVIGDDLIDAIGGRYQVTTTYFTGADPGLGP